MIQIDNKFDVGQEVHLVGRKCYTNGKKKRFKWVVKSKKDKPLKYYVSSIRTNCMEKMNYAITSKIMEK